MWANEEVADFLAWLREWNLARPAAERVGFYGLDVYSLWDSLREIIGWLDVHAPDVGGGRAPGLAVLRPVRRGPPPLRLEHPTRPRVVRARRGGPAGRGPPACRRPPVDDEGAFDAWQNAEVAVDAERYYRIMVRGDRESWNVRDHHMVDTVDRLARHMGHGSKGLVWAHNTHVGDARATDMARAGLVNVGQLLRERVGDQGVSLIGFASHRGSVVAGAGVGRAGARPRRPGRPGRAATRTCCTPPWGRRPSSSSTAG